MVKKLKIYSLYIGGVFVVTILALFPWQVQSQQVGIPHDQYLQLIDWGEEGEAIKEKLIHGLREHSPDASDEQIEQNATFFSMVMVLSGITLDRYQALESHGVDMIHAITADSRPFGEQALLADLAVIGMVTATNYDEDYDDGFDFSVEITVQEFLKGKAPSDRVIIRQDAEQRLTDSHTSPELGQTYLLLLSSGMYGYHAANFQFREQGQTRVSVPKLGEESKFLIYRMYKIINDQLVQVNQDVGQAISEIEDIDKTINLEQDVR